MCNCIIRFHVVCCFISTSTGPKNNFFSFWVAFVVDGSKLIFFISLFFFTFLFFRFVFSFPSSSNSKCSIYRRGLQRVLSSLFGCCASQCDSHFRRSLQSFLVSHPHLIYAHTSTSCNSCTIRACCPVLSCPVCLLLVDVSCS